MADLFDVIGKRTMVRTFKDTPVSKHDRDHILEAGIRAPNAGGNEQWAFVLIESDLKKAMLVNQLKRAQSLYFTEAMKKAWTKERMDSWFASSDNDLYKAPLYIAILVDLRERFYTRQAIEELWAHHSAAAAAENMLLAAWGLGIGGCWFGVPLLMESSFNELLEIDGKGLRIAAILAFGYPKEMTAPRKRRKGLTSLVRSV
jgi:nitroreductase